jgi:hypothetical protein
VRLILLPIVAAGSIEYRIGGDVYQTNVGISANTGEPAWKLDVQRLRAIRVGLTLVDVRKRRTVDDPIRAGTRKQLGGRRLCRQINGNDFECGLADAVKMSCSDDCTSRGECLVRENAAQEPAGARDE